MNGSGESHYRQDTFGEKVNNFTPSVNIVNDKDDDAFALISYPTPIRLSGLLIN